MDPTSNLKEQLELVDQLIDSDHDPDVNRLAELVSALHHWIIRGGHLPLQWRRPVDPDEGLLDDPGEQLN